MATRRWISTSSEDWNTASNWSGNAVPATGDTVIIENSAVSITTGLDQSAVTLARLEIAQTFTGQIGTSSAYLRIGATILNIGNSAAPAPPSGSNRIKIDLGAAASTVTINDSAASSADTNVPPILLLANHSSTTVTVNKGRVGIAAGNAGETSTVGTVTANYNLSRSSDAEVVLGPGVTVTTVNAIGGTLLLQSSCTTLNVNGGSVTTRGTGAITTVNANSGKARLDSTGTIATLNAAGAEVDFLRSAAARTVTTLNFTAGRVDIDASVLTITNRISPAGRLSIRAEAA